MKTNVYIGVRFDKPPVSIFPRASGITYDEDVGGEMSVDYDLPSDDGASIYKPRISSASITVNLRPTGNSHEWYNNPQDPFLVTVKTVSSIKIEDLASNDRPLIQEYKPREPFWVSGLRRWKYGDVQSFSIK